MLIPIDDIDKGLKIEGFEQSVPLNEKLCLAGECRESELTDAPIGYYRFHYWTNADTYKDHSNFTFLGKLAGYVCVSVIEETNLRAKTSAYRVLIRTLFGWKTIMINANIFEAAKVSKSDRDLIIAVSAVKKFALKLIGEVQDDNLAHVPSPDSPVDLSEIDVNSFSEKPLTPSISPVLSDARSRFGSSHASLSLSRCGSFASLADLSLNGMCQDDFANIQRMKNIADELLAKFMKGCVQIKDKEFPYKLLDLEKTLNPSSLNFDFVCLTSDESQNCQQFLEILGKDINRQEILDYSAIIKQKFNMRPQIQVLPQSEEEELQPIGHMIRAMIEFVRTEMNFLDILKLGDKYFVSHLRDHKTDKFILKQKEYQTLFEGLSQYITIHQPFLDALLQCQRKDSMEPSAFAEALFQFASSHVLNSYQTYFTSMPSREKSLADYLKNNKKFESYHDQCSRLPEFERRTLQDILIAPVQRVTRYPLLLKEIVGHATDDSLRDKLQKCCTMFEETTRHLNNVKARAEQTEKLFEVQREVYNFPPEFLKVGRRILTQLECMLADTNSDKSAKKQFALYICNDLVIFTRKRELQSPEGIKNDFIFAIDLRHIQVNLVRGRNHDSISFTVNIDIEQACFTNDVVELENIAVGHGLSTESQPLGTTYHFLPLDGKQLRIFLAEFHDARNQHLLGGSPAALRLRKENEREIFFHIFKKDDFYSWCHKSPVAIVFMGEIDSEENLEFLDKFSEYHSVAIIQSRANGYRFCIRSKAARKITDDAFEPKSELLPLPTFFKSFFAAIVNAHIQYSVYPPYEKQVQQQQRFVLENAVALSKSFSRAAGTIRGFFSSLLNRSESQRSQSVADRLSRGPSVKSSPLASPSKPMARREFGEGIQLDIGLSHLHL